VLVAGSGSGRGRWQRHGRLHGQAPELLEERQEHPRHAQLALRHLCLQLLDVVLHDVLLLLALQVLRLQPLHLDLFLRVCDRHVCGIRCLRSHADHLLIKETSREFEMTWIARKRATSRAACNRVPRLVFRL